MTRETPRAPPTQYPTLTVEQAYAHHDQIPSIFRLDQLA